MKRNWDFKSLSSVPEAHIQVLRQEDASIDIFQMNEGGVRRYSLAQEARDGSVVLPGDVANPDNISNMEKGTTFAARARAAELNSVRAAAAAAQRDVSMIDEGDEVPAIGPVSLGSLKFTLPKRRDVAKAARSHSSTSNLAAPSVNPDTADLRHAPTNFPDNIRSDGGPTHQLIKTLQSATLSRRESALDQQAIRQKVREVSARQQSNHNVSEEERIPLVLPSSASVSPYSSSEGRIGLAQAAKRAELNTQHIREIRREAEKQRDLVQSRGQQYYNLGLGDILEENRPLVYEDTNQHAPGELNDGYTDMSFYSSRIPEGPYTSYVYPQNDYNTGDRAILRLTGSPVARERQYGQSDMPSFSQPPVMMGGNTLSSQHFSTTRDSNQASPNDASRNSGSVLSAQLRATSPAFIPSSIGLGITYDRGQQRSPLPSVKGTERVQPDRHHNQMPYLPQSSLNAGNATPDRAASSSTQLPELQAPKIPTEPANIRKKAQGNATTTNSTAKIRDPMPYTGFSSKRDALLSSLQKAIDESTAKGELPSSNRSVLHDPGAPVTPSGPKYNSPSSSGHSNARTNLNMSSRSGKPEIPPFTFPQPPPARSELDYDPDTLKESDPLPLPVDPKPIETKLLSSPEEGYGYRRQPNRFPTAAPHFPPGLTRSSNTFLEAEMSNEKGFWDDSLAMNAGNASIEDSVEKLASQHHNGFSQPSWQEAGTQANGSKTNAWIEAQKLLLRPKGAPNIEELEQKALLWFDSGRNNLEDRVKNSLQHAEGISPVTQGAKYWEAYPQKHARTVSGSCHAPIGSERPNDLHTNQEPHKRAAIDIMANVLANLASYHGGDNSGPTQRYSQPPAWCIDQSEAGRKSFFNDNWGDVPKRVGRDPRYQKTVHEGRTTYFEDPSSAGRRDGAGYKATPGWGSSR